MFEESRCYFNQPFGVDSTHFSHIFFSRLHQLMVDNPLRSLTEQGRTRVDEYLLVVSNSSVAFGWVLFAAMEEESCSDCLPDLGEIFSFHIGSSRRDWQLEAFHDHH